MGPHYPLLLILVSMCLYWVPTIGVVSWYHTAPGVRIQAPFEVSGQVLILEAADMGLDPDAGVFYLNISTYVDQEERYRSFRRAGKPWERPLPPIISSLFGLKPVTVEDDVTGPLPPVNLTGGLTFTQQGDISFSYLNENATACLQARSSPPLCPFMQGQTSGPYEFSAWPISGATQNLAIQTSGWYYNPFTGTARNFLGAFYAFEFVCVGSCASIYNAVPSSSASLPANGSFTVCHRYIEVPSGLSSNKPFRTLM